MHVSRVTELEGDEARDLRLTTALRLLHPLGASIDQLAERIFWNPGQSIPPRPVATRHEAASIIGANVRSIRERRHLTQVTLGRMASLSKAGLSLIERGVRETSIQTLFALARSLEVPPELLFQGID